MKKLLLLLSAFILFKTGQAQVPTWAHDVAPIFYANCTSCHHDGGSSIPFILYSDAAADTAKIREDVVQKIMPPWPPDPKYIRLAHERILSQKDINKIRDWVDGGALPGDTTTAPSAPVYTKGSALGTPDLTLSIPAYTVPLNQTSDIYQCFVLPSGLLQDKYITAIEIIPGNSAIVHHVLVYQDTTGACAQLDAASPGPGYLNFGGIGTNSAILVGGWVPGSQPYSLPPNMGIPLFTNTDVVLQIHYPKNSNGMVDSATTINLKLANSVSRLVGINAPLNHITSINKPLIIPADSVMTFREHYKSPAIVDLSILTVGPHCHLLEQNWISFGVTPTGDTIPFIKINKWDFRWQGFYPFRNPVKIPKNTDMYAFATYDNTSNNESNPNSPPQQVTLGENTTNEMMLVYFSYLLYQAGDENIVVDSTALVDITDTVEVSTGVIEPNGIVSQPQLYEAEPNPANEKTMFVYFLPSSALTEIRIYDVSGKLVDALKAPNMPGFNKVNYNTSKLEAGTYLYSLVSEGIVKSKQLVITR